MGAFEDFVDIVKQTETMQALFQSLEREPAKLLTAICREYEVTNKAILRALVSANLVTREREDRFALYGYKPTEAGLRYYKAMLDEKKI